MEDVMAREAVDVAALEAQMTASADDAFARMEIPRADLEAADAVLGFSGPWRFLSNFWRAPGLSAFGIAVPTAEHGYMMAKVDPAHPERWALVRAIAQAPRPQDAKRLGRQAPLRPDWDAVKYDFLRAMLARKFAPGSDLAEKLVATGRRPLVELNTWGDQVWGMTERKDGALVGANALGKLLAERRAQLAGG